MSELVRFSQEGAVAKLVFDDGKANAVSHAAIDALHAALDRAEKEAGAVAWIGRPGRFSAGFDLATMRAGPDAARSLVKAGALLLVRMCESPVPIVAGCTGHALAMGALLLLGSDSRIGAQGDWKLGLNEVAIGLTLPIFALELARERLSRRHLQRATAFAEVYAPEAALDAGYLDRVVAADRVETEALAEAKRLAELPRRAFAETKKRARADALVRIRARLDADLDGWSAS
jgi:enoyl-CoA hydratase